MKIQGTPEEMEQAKEPELTYEEIDRMIREHERKKKQKAAIKRSKKRA